MLEALPLLATTFLFASTFIYIFTSIILHDLRQNWNERRCEFLSILVAQSIPDGTDPNVDGAGFAFENFSFCISKIIDGSLFNFLGPLMAIFSKQLDAAQPIKASLNSYRSSLSNILTTPFNSYVNSIWKRLGYIVHAFANIFMKMSSAFDRIFGIIVATIFAGISMYKSILNTKNFLMKICVIILYIIIALLFLLFIPLFPVIPVLIIPTITALAIAGAQVGTMGTAFNCVAPGTLVACKDGWKAVETLQVGDELRDGNVTGILHGIPGGRCVKIGKVVISGLHVVYDRDLGRWVHASDHTEALPCKSPEMVYCLTTSTQTWIVEGGLLLRDWTDIPDTDYAFEKMESFVWNMLHEKFSQTEGNEEEDFVPNKGLSLISGSMYILHKDGYTPISNIKVNDFVFDGEGFTEVVGVYKGLGSGEKAGTRDSTWIWNQTRNRWIHPILQSDAPDIGYNIITRSGKYSLSGEIRRDLTEIGCDRLYETRRIVLSLLNNRNDEEECIFT